ncbi:MAG TPA: hypothetical protein DD620_03475, partial [Verrucomicrobia bacterium]|nr:hypothetical protein [Verrucomicrobiota bacterium]
MCLFQRSGNNKVKKPTPIILLSLSILLISGCGKVVEESELKFIDGKYYPITSDKPYSGKMVSFYENGQMRFYGTIHDGIEVIPFVRYYKNGQLKESFSKNGYVEYYENGQLSEVYNKKDRTLKEYYKNGQLEGSSHKNGYVEYYENGQL